MNKARGHAASLFIQATMSERFHSDFAVADFDQVDIRLALAAFLALWPGLAERDLAVQTLYRDIPQCSLDRRRLGLASLFDRCRCRANPVVATEALSAAGEVVAALFPFRDEVVGRLRVRGLVGEPGQERRQVH